MLLLNPRQPDFVEIAVDYYDAHEKAAFTAGPYPAEIEDVAGKILKIPIAEFLTYYLFGDKEYAVTPPTFAELKKDIRRADYAASKFFAWDQNSLTVQPRWRSLSNDDTKALGDAAAMAIANRIHTITEADWSYIERAPVPTLDWHYASDGKNHIEVEAKGCFVADASRLTGLSNAKGSIQAKKQAAQQPSYHRPKALRYGTILAIDKNPGSPLHCRLVDPDGSPIERDPQDTRLLSRFRWATNILTTISPRSPFVMALRNRLNALEALKDPFELNGVKLTRSDGQSLGIAPEQSYQWSPFFKGRSHIDDLAQGGAVTRYDEKHLLFYGLCEDWLLALAAQDFEKLLSIRAKPQTLETEAYCVLTAAQIKAFGLTEHRSLPLETEGTLQVNLPARIHQSAGGLSFGLVSLG